MNVITISMESYLNSYSPVGDILVMATIMVLGVLIRVAYIKQNREYRIFRYILAGLFAAAVSDIVFHQMIASYPKFPNIIIYTVRILYHFLLFSNLALYVLYMKNPFQLTGRGENRYGYIAFCLVFCVLFIEIAGAINQRGFVIFKNRDIQLDHVGFIFGYLLLVVFLMYLLVRYRNRTYRPIVMAFIGTGIVAVFVMYIQARHHQQSFTTATFLFPIIAVLYLLHANPYDLEWGSLHVDSFEERIETATKKKTDIIIFSLFLHEFEKSNRKYPKEIREKIREVTMDFFKGGTLFQISPGRMIFVIEKAINPNHEERMYKMMQLFHEQHKIYKHDYKIIIVESNKLIKEPTDYIRLIEYVEKRMPEKEIKMVQPADIDSFYSHKYIVDQLADINEKKDLEDPRIVVYCQPVYNIATGTYDTAEALMRLNLGTMGMVFPDRFIPIAESHNYINALTMIILSKTCNQIKKFLNEGYDISRISVNFSILDVKDKDFCKKVRNIVTRSGIPFEKVAIEITESQNEKDFIEIKEKIYELKESGITFYLDDFGTGYSNFERIMEIPFDIIKFDRSLVIASGNDGKSETMVTHLAHMFSDLDYSVLYEGVEDEKDEDRCKRMFASYLQGYKYSKPIPIERLYEFLSIKED